jgi:phenylalanyl-tRNA synthetase beta chain
LPGYLVPGRGAALVIGGRPVGWFGEVTAAAREALDLAQPVFAAELSLTALLALPPAPPVYRPLPRFPAVQRDLAVVVPAGVTAAEIEAAIRALDLPLLVRVALFDVYTGAQVGAGQKSLAFGLTWQAPDRTLTDREVNELHARVVAELRTRVQADVRGQ